MDLIWCKTPERICHTVDTSRLCNWYVETATQSSIVLTFEVVHSGQNIGRSRLETSLPGVSPRLWSIYETLTASIVSTLSVGSCFVASSVVRVVESKLSLIHLKVVLDPFESCP